jgi:hypothetical protein
MAERRTVYYDANGIRRTLIVDDERPGFVVQTEQNVDEILAGIARRRELMRQGGDTRHVAQIPVEIFERMVLEGWGPDDEARWLNSSEAAPWRIWRGRV